MTRRKKMTNEKKKGTPFGVPIPQQDYGTTPEEKSEAERLFDKIGTGAAYALRRPKDAKVDRQLRKLIADANLSGDCIINDGSGYFRPGDDDDIAFETYIAAERSRAREILRKTSRMQQVYDRRYQTNE
jgi:hypothetical protein